MRKPKNPTILAIETSADETSAAVFRNRKIASNIIYSQIARHQKTGGIVPEVAARAHIPKVIPAIDEALKQSKAKLADIDALAVSAGPGLITSLMVGVDTAKAISFSLDKPIIPVNHLEGHLLSALGGKNFQFPISNFQKLFPAVGLIASGGHTMLVLVHSIGRYKILGETLDDAAGEAFDKIAKIMGLPYPGGPEIALRAEKFKSQKPKIKIVFPRPLLTSNDYNFSFSGLKTAALYKIKELKENKKFNDQTVNQISRETENAIVDVLVEKTVRAAKQYKAKIVLLGGGVAANKKLRSALKTELKKQIPGSSFLAPGSSLSTDNAGMISLAGYLHFLNNDYTTFDKVKLDPNLELKSWR